MTDNKRSGYISHEEAMFRARVNSEGVSPFLRKLRYVKETYRVDDQTARKIIDEEENTNADNN